jgi:alanyl-tRNA synthetase
VIFVLAVAVRVLTACRRPRRIRHGVLSKDGQVLPLVDTNVTFPAGGLISDSTVLAVLELSDSGWAGATGLVTDISPFHPIDPGWPDQGPDRGTAVIKGCAVEVVDVILGATQGGNLLISTNIPVRRGEPGWAFVVVHVLATAEPIPSVGERVELRVDPAHREALSFGHTACHVAGLALNAALADQWRKPVAPDGLGHPNFDRQALTSSRIHPNGAIDVYRLGKSLRKKGFDSNFDAGAVAVLVNETLARWVAVGARIRIETEGQGLTDRRTWVGTLPDGEERIACGGTHPTSLEGFAAIEVALTLADSELTMETKVTPV